VVSFCLNAQNWLWAQSGGSSIGSEIAWGVTVDNQGNSYATGQFFSTCTFGSFTLTSAGAEDIFIVKYDASGNVSWAKGIGSNSSDYTSRIAVDTVGNIYVEGIFNNTVNFGNTSLTCSGWNDIFVAKYDTNGNEIWVRQGGGSDYFEYAADIAVDNNANVYATGSFSSVSADFGSTHMINSSSAVHLSDIFIIKYDPNGNILWTIHPTGLGSEAVSRLSIDSNGDIYVLASFNNTINFGGTTYTSFGSNDMILMKYDAAGSFIFAKQMGGVNMDLPYGLALDQSNNIYLTGGFSGTSTFGSNILTTVGIYNELVLAKLDPSGNDLWIKQIAATTNCVGIAVETDSNNNVFVACDFYGTTNFGATNMISLGSEDIFIGKYDPNGTEQWAIQAGGTDFDEIRDMAIDQNGFIYGSGRFRSTASFGSTNLTCAGNEDAWTAKLQGPSTLATNSMESSNSTIEIFPNPVNNQLHFSTYLEEFTISNNIGQVILKSQGNSISTENFNNGIYFIKTQESCLKFIVKH